eukprot:Gb_36422 [translate_table: standard]
MSDHHRFLGRHGHKEGETKLAGKDISYEKAKKEEKHHKHKERMGQVGTLAAASYALHEKHEAKKDPANAHKHHLKQHIATGTAVVGGVYTLHEHHRKEEAKEAKRRAKK